MLDVMLNTFTQPHTHSCTQVSQALLGGKSAAESGVDAYVLRRLQADVQMQLTAFKNAAFTAGYNKAVCVIEKGGCYTVATGRR
jgi:Tfp pilus assembly PilM family ATPase